MMRCRGQRCPKPRIGAVVGREAFRTRAADRPRGAAVLTLLVGGVEIANGVLMLIVPGQFAGPAYRLIAPFAQVYGAILLLGGLIIVGGATRAAARRYSSLASLLLLPLWWSFLSAGLVSGVVTLGVQMLAGLAAGFAPSRLPRRAPALAFGAIQILLAAAMLAYPQQFSNPALYGGFGSVLWVFAPSFAVAGAGLLLARTERTRWGFAVLAALNFGALAATFAGTRTWTGTLNYGLMLWLLLVSQVAKGATARLLLLGVIAVATADLIPWVAAVAGLPAPLPTVAGLRPRTIAGVIVLASTAAFLARTRPRLAVGVSAAVCAVSASLLGMELYAQRAGGAVIGRPDDPRPTITAIALMLVAAVGVAGAAARVTTVRWVAAASGALLAVISSLTMLAHVVDQDVLFSGLGVVALRLNTALAFALLGSGLLALVLPDLLRASVAARLATGFAAVFALLAIQLFVGTAAIDQLPALMARDPSAGAGAAGAALGILAGSFAAMAAAMLAVAVATTRSILTPLRAVVGAMQRFERGERGVRVAVRGNDELSRVGGEFNAMAAQLDGMRSRLEAEANDDPLTLIPNRRRFDDRLRQAIDDAARQGSSCVCVVLDLDGFKPVNDRFGHSAGDVVLRTIATRGLEAIRPSDTFARIGGDEFGAVLPDTDRVGARIVVERIRRAVEGQVTLDASAGDVRVHGSFGLAVFPQDGSSADELIAAADAAMYAAKRARDGAAPARA